MSRNFSRISSYSAIWSVALGHHHLFWKRSFLRCSASNRRPDTSPSTLSLQHCQLFRLRTQHKHAYVSCHHLGYSPFKSSRLLPTDLHFYRSVKIEVGVSVRSIILKTKIPSGVGKLRWRFNPSSIRTPTNRPLDDQSSLSTLAFQMSKPSQSVIPYLSHTMNTQAGRGVARHNFRRQPSQSAPSYIGVRGINPRKICEFCIASRERTFLDNKNKLSPSLQ